MGVDRRELAAVFVGGCAGAMARAQLAESLAPAAGGWPWATFVANLVGAFLLGYAAALLGDRGPTAELRLRLLGTGFCGALTTFSTLQFELLVMLDDGDGGWPRPTCSPAWPPVWRPSCSVTAWPVGCGGAAA